MIPELSEVVIKDGEVVAVDLETYDPDLKKHGSGAILGKGFVVGIALAYGDKKFYIPLILFPVFGLLFCYFQLFLP